MVGNLKTLRLPTKVGEWVMGMKSTNPYSLRVVGKISVITWFNQKWKFCVFRHALSWMGGSPKFQLLYIMSHMFWENATLSQAFEKCVKQCGLHKVLKSWRYSFILFCCMTPDQSLYCTEHWKNKEKRILKTTEVTEILSRWLLVRGGEKTSGHKLQFNEPTTKD